MPDIFLHGVSKVYDNGSRAVDNLDLSIHDGELLVLVGPSGCGKTTTLRLIAGLEEPTTGDIHIGGRSVQGVPSWQRDVAMVLQKPTLVPSRTVRGNLNFSNELRRGFAGHLLDWLPSERRRQERRTVDDVAELLGLKDVLERRPAELSGGQQQRVALGRTLVRKATVRLLDEPLGQLDGPLRRQLRRELHLLHQQFPATMIHVTHDSEEALALGDRIAVLHQGVLLQVDTAERLLSRPRHRFVAEFFPTEFGPWNMLEGQIVQEGDTPVFRMGERKLLLPDGRGEIWRKNVGRSVVLAVRPDNISIQCEQGGTGDGWVMRVLLVEHASRGSLILCERDGLRVTAFLRLTNAVMAVIGTEATIVVRLERTLLFDAETGKILNLE